MPVILPAVPGLMRLDLDWATQTKNWTTAFHVLKTIAAPWTTVDMNAVLTATASALTADILPLYGSNTTSTGMTGTDLSSTMGIVVNDDGAGSGTGTGTHPLPINNVIRSSYRPPIRYRGGRPGNSWSGLDMADQETGNCTMWATATRTGWISAIDNLITALTGLSLPGGGNSNLVTVSYFTGHALRPTPLTFQLVPGEVEVQQRVCSKRRRLGRGVPGE